MESTFGTYLRERRRAVGLTQEELGHRAGIGKAHISQLEIGKIKLPNAAVRRELARALGVSHLDLLIAAGELLPEEVREAGKAGVIEERPDDPRHALQALSDQVVWERPDRVALMRAILTQWLSEDRSP